MITNLHNTTVADAPVPDWIHLVPNGTFRGSDGRGPYTLANPDAVIADSMRNAKIPIDVNHSTDLASPRGEESPAIGWVVDMQSRPDGIWANVEWTEQGHRLIAQRAYRGISPVFVVDKSGTILRVERAALTNVPNLPQLTSLHAVQGAMARAHTVVVPYQPTPIDREVCAKMGVDLSRFAAHRSHNHSAQATFGLSADELMVCKRMNLDPERFAAMRGTRREMHAPPEASGFPSFPPANLKEPPHPSAPKIVVDHLGLTPEERFICDQGKVDYAHYAAFKKNGGESPLVAKVPPESMNACKRIGMDPNEWARRYFRTNIPGEDLQKRA